MCFVATIKSFLIRKREKREEERKTQPGGPMPHEKGLTKNEFKTESRAEKSSNDYFV